MQFAGSGRMPWRMRGIANTAEQGPSTLVGPVVSDIAGLKSALLSAAAGTVIFAQSGFYGGTSASTSHELDAPFSTPENPVIVRAYDPATPPVFRERYDVGRNSNSSIQFWGIDFDDSHAGAVEDRRLVRLWNAPDCGFFYCDLTAAGMALEINDNDAIGLRLHRSRWHSQPSGGTSGRNAVKLGISTSLATDFGTLIDYCLFEDYDDSRETISGKGRFRMYRSHMIGCRDIATRHARLCVIEECRLEGSQARIQINGPDHIVRGNVTPEIEVWRGTQDGDNTFNGTGGEYLAGKRTVIQSNECPSIRVGEYPFGDASLGGVQATGTLASRNSSSLVSVNGATWGEAPSVVTTPPPELTTATSGVGALGLSGLVIPP